MPVCEMSSEEIGCDEISVNDGKLKGGKLPSVIDIML